MCPKLTCDVIYPMIAWLAREMNMPLCHCSRFNDLMTDVHHNSKVVLEKRIERECEKEKKKEGAEFKHQPAVKCYFDLMSSFPLSK